METRLFKLFLIAVIIASVLILFLPVTAPAGPQTPDFRGHMEKLRGRLPGPEFTIVEARPFVVIGDEEPEIVRRRSRETVGWAVKRLKESYFQRDPEQIIDIWLFKNRKSYEQNVARLWNENPGTPFGYYSSRHKVLVMNISTGGGTLVHEIVHPFMEANFPTCPDWFNEGLASLYEQCREDRNGRIEGTTNWRLEGLQKAISRGKLQTFKQLTSRDFYGDDDGTNYAMARYLCYYLQQEGKLQAFYRDLAANNQTDPTGYATLRKTLGNPDMVVWQEEWEQFVRGLRF